MLGAAPRVAVEAASPFGWTRYVASEADVVGMNGFGASGPAKQLYEHFGITAEHVARKARALLGRTPQPRGESIVTAKLAINGFGRIGRNVLRALAEHGRERHRGGGDQRSGPARHQRAPVPLRQRAWPLPRRGQARGRHAAHPHRRGQTLPPVKVLAERELAKLPWGQLGVDIVLECTGIFTSKDKASGHLGAGAKRVLVSAPADGADLTVVFGVNQDQLRPEHTVVSNASCTTNCLAPVAKVLQRPGRDRARSHDHDPLLHQRPEPARRLPQGSLPRAAPRPCR